MPKTRHMKEQEVTRIKENLTASRAVVVTVERKVNIKDTERLRKELRAAGAEFVSTKKTLFTKAVAGGPLADLPVTRDGTVALTYSYADETSAAKIVHAFTKDHPDFVIVGGLLEARFLTTDEIATLAKLPGKKELLGALVATVVRPLRGLVNVLTAPTRDFLTVLRAIGDSK